MTDTQYKYDVALSFAGEDREFVKFVATQLKAKNIKVFYDEYEQTNLWGKDLYVHLDEVYRNKSKYCVIFISKYYKNKLWTNHERVSAQARAFEENIEYILPFKLDDTDIPGIRPTVGYLSKKSVSVEQLVEAIINKVKGFKREQPTLKNINQKYHAKSLNPKSNSTTDDYIVLYIESGKFSEDPFIFKHHEVIVSNRQINITSNFEGKLLEILEKPKEKSFGLWESDNRWVKVFIENKLIIGLATSLERISEDNHLLKIEIKDREHEFKIWNRSQISEIKKLLKYLLCNKLSDGETPLDNILTKNRTPYSMRSIITKPSLFSAPICPIPGFYSQYLNDNDWIQFCLKAKAAIIEKLEFLELIDVIDKFEITRNENNEIEVKFSGILKFSSENIIGSKLTINEKCDLSMDNVHAYYESLKIE